MSHTSSIPYHLTEQAIATNPSDPRHVYPQIRDDDRVIVDLGCGIGQSWSAIGGEGRMVVGIDIDDDALRYGHDLGGGQMTFVRAEGTAIPLADGSVDLVFSRVAIPYMNVPQTVREIRRVLRPGGRVWLSLHPFSVALAYLRDGLRQRHPKRIVHAVYILWNGCTLALDGVVWPFFNGRYESWQSTTAMVRLLRRAGFVATGSRSGSHHLVEGVLA